MPNYLECTVTAAGKVGRISKNNSHCITDKQVKTILNYVLLVACNFKREKIYILGEKLFFFTILQFSRPGWTWQTPVQNIKQSRQRKNRSAMMRIIIFMEYFWSPFVFTYLKKYTRINTTHRKNAAHELRHYVLYKAPRIGWIVSKTSISRFSVSKSI